MYKAKKGEGRRGERARGTWKELHCPDKISASFICPECGTYGDLDEHDIGSDGLVTPSVECATEGCTWHDTIVLEGWIGINGSHLTQIM
jgi:hypothetical protein